MFTPDMCLALNNMTIDKEGFGEVIHIRALETGYYKTSSFMTQEQVDEMNWEVYDVDIPTSRAMATASMFGWDVYLANLKIEQELFNKKQEEK